MPSLLAGAARCEITPPPGLAMMGYSRREGVGTGAHDPLHCRALVFSDGATHWALAVCELLCFAQELCDPIADRVAAATDIPAANVWVAATHTHSAPFFNLWKSPATPEGPARPGRDVAWEYALPEHVADTIVGAWRARQPASVAFVEASADIGANRRCPTADGDVRLIPYDDGVADHAVGVMAVVDEADELLALLVNHACHGVVLTEDNLLYSGDWLGLCAAHLEREVAPGGTVLLAQGACGNIDPRRRGSFELAEAAAQEVAAAVSTALADATYSGDVTLSVEAVPLRLPLKDTRGAVARGKAHVAQVERNIDNHTTPDSTHTQRLQDELQMAQEGLGRALAAHEANDRFPRADLDRGELTCLLRMAHVNGHAFVGVPGEPFTELSLAVRAAASAAPAFVLGYCHDYIGYIPTHAAYEDGGYEVQSSRLAPGGHEILLDAIAAALTR